MYNRVMFKGKLDLMEHLFFELEIITMYLIKACLHIIGKLLTLLEDNQLAADFAKTTTN